MDQTAMWLKFVLFVSAVMILVQSADFKMKPKILGAKNLFKRDIIQLIEQFSEPLVSIKMAMTHKQWSAMEITGVLKPFPAESATQMFHDLDTNKILWEKSDDITTSIINTERIGTILQQKKDTMGNDLFDCLTVGWSTNGIKQGMFPFYKALMTPISRNVDVKRRRDTTAISASRSHDRATPLMEAALYDAKSAVARLIERGAQIEAADSEGETSLHYSANFGGAAACRVLLESGAKVNAVNNNLRTALMIASQRGHIGVVKVLLEFGADVTMKNNYQKPKTAIEMTNNSDIRDLIREKTGIPKRKREKNKEKKYN